jgi:type VII secretion-associated protein (TIGR03931 family)
VTAPVAAAVQVGTATVRVARTGPAGPVVAETDIDARLPLAALLAGLAEGAVTLVPDPAVAMAAAQPGPSPVVVLDVGADRGEAVLVRDGAVAARRTGPGGRHLDAVVAGLLVARRPAWAGRPELGAEARRVREALSLLPAAEAALPGGRPLPVAADAVREVLRAPLGELVVAARALAGPGDVPVLVAGGVARTPLLAELLDAAGLPDVRVAARPEAAGVLAALAGPAAAAPSPARPPPRPPLLPPVPRRAGRLRGAAAAVLAVALLAGLHAVGDRLAPPAAAGGPPGLLAQYDYRFVVPAGWAHTGGRPDRRRVLLTPLAAPEGSDLVVVESSPLGYDAAAEPERAAEELRAVYDAGLRAGGALSGYDDRASFAGRAVTAYTEDASTTTVRWFVLLDSPSQLSVGCRHTTAGTAAVLAACAGVVATLRRG